ncbi:hypothetical protein [Calothrix sp. FACHB-168]|nr:hypothetical protein [Calothrix sp. FACHB-168]
MPNAQCPMPNALFPIINLHPQICARLVIYLSNKLGMEYNKIVNI